MSSPIAIAEVLKELHFLNLGVQYYVAARCAALAGLPSVCGNLYHHAIEMLVKARLSQTRTLEVLSQRDFGHNLKALWTAFKAEFPGAGLEQFDDTVVTLHRFERLRYPDAIIQEGAAVQVMWALGTVSSSYGLGITPPPTYRIVVTEIDYLVARIFEVSSYNPAFFTGPLRQYGHDAISRDNPVGDVWFPPPPLTPV